MLGNRFCFPIFGLGITSQDKEKARPGKVVACPPRTNTGSVSLLPYLSAIALCLMPLLNNPRVCKEEHPVREEAREYLRLLDSRASTGLAEIQMKI